MDKLLLSISFVEVVAIVVAFSKLGVSGGVAEMGDAQLISAITETKTY